MEKHLEQNDIRFEQFDTRFEQIDRHFAEMTRRIDRFMFWSPGLTISTALFVVNYLK